MNEWMSNSCAGCCKYM